MSAISEGSLPYLLKDQSYTHSPSRQELVRVLKYIDQWRDWMYQIWQGEGANDPAEEVDDLFSIAVLLYYCARRWSQDERGKQ